MWSLDTTSVKEQERKPWEPVPKGKYKVIFNKFEVEEPKTSRKGAEYRGVKIGAQIIEGDHQGLVVSDYIIVEHETSQTAADIGQRLVKQLVVATSADPNMTEETIGQLLNVPVMINVDVEVGNTYIDGNGDEQKYSDRNRIRRVAPIDSLEDLLSGNASKPATKPETTKSAGNAGASWMD